MFHNHKKLVGYCVSGFVTIRCCYANYDGLKLLVKVIKHSLMVIDSIDLDTHFPPEMSKVIMICNSMNII